MNKKWKRTSVFGPIIKSNSVRIIEKLTVYIITVSVLIARQQNTLRAQKRTIKRPRTMLTGYYTA